MKALRSTLILLFVALLGGGWIYWQERGPRITPDAVVLLRATKNEARRVVLRPANLFIERNSSGSWRVREERTGLSAPLDEQAGREFWAQIEAVQSILPVENPEGAAQYGLERPRAAIEVDGRKLEFGAPAAFDPKWIYARGDGHIALLSAELFAKTARPFSEWRDRSVVNFNPDSVAAFSLRNGKTRLDFHKTGDSWKLQTSGSRAKNADADAIENLLNSLSQSKTTRWLDERGQNAARYGLKTPRIVFESGKSRLEIGDRTAGGYAARSAGSAAIFLLPDAIFGLLDRPISDWRDRRVANFEINLITRLEISAGGRTRVLVREADDWRLENGRPDPKLRAAALDLLDFARNLRASGFLEDATIEREISRGKVPLSALKAVAADGTPIFALRFGRVGKKLTAKNQLTPETLFELDGDALDKTEAARTAIFGPRD